MNRWTGFAVALAVSLVDVYAALTRSLPAEFRVCSVVGAVAGVFAAAGFAADVWRDG